MQHIVHSVATDAAKWEDPTILAQLEEHGIKIVCVIESIARLRVTWPDGENFLKEQHWIRTNVFESVDSSDALLRSRTGQYTVHSIATDATKWKDAATLDLLKDHGIKIVAVFGAIAQLLVAGPEAEEFLRRQPWIRVSDGEFMSGSAVLSQSNKMHAMGVTIPATPGHPPELVLYPSQTIVDNPPATDPLTLCNTPSQ